MKHDNNMHTFWLKYHIKEILDCQLTEKCITAERNYETLPGLVTKCIRQWWYMYMYIARCIRMNEERAWTILEGHTCLDQLCTSGTHTHTVKHC